MNCIALVNIAIIVLSCFITTQNRLCNRHPDPKQCPLSGMILKTLQKPDGTLLATSEVTTSRGANQTSMMLGAPLAAGHQLHLDLQHGYTTD